MSRYVTGLVGSLLLPVLVVAASLGQVGDLELVDRIVATVDDDPIFLSDIRRSIDLGLVERAGGESEDQLDDALALALAATGPFVVDVRIDASEASPLLKRFESLIKQGNSKNVAGWEKN